MKFVAATYVLVPTGQRHDVPAATDDQRSLREFRTTSQLSVHSADDVFRIFLELPATNRLGDKSLRLVATFLQGFQQSLANGRFQRLNPTSPVSNPLPKLAELKALIESLADGSPLQIDMRAYTDPRHVGVADPYIEPLSVLFA